MRKLPWPPVPALITLLSLEAIDCMTADKVKPDGSFVVAVSVFTSAAYAAPLASEVLSASTIMFV